MSVPAPEPPAATGTSDGGSRGPTGGAPRVAALLLAAGEGRRVGAGANKVLLPLLGEAVFTWSLRTVLGLPRVTEVVLVHRPVDREQVDAGLDLLAAHHPAARVWLVGGGESRHDSEWRGLQAVAHAVDVGAVDVVAVHDTARPLASAELWQRVVESAHEHGGALPVRPQPHLLPRAVGTPRRTDLVSVQTPQAFRAGPLLEAYRRAAADGFLGTDTAACVEHYTDLEIRGVPGSATNLKITYPDDVVAAEALLNVR